MSDPTTRSRPKNGSLAGLGHGTTSAWQRWSAVTASVSDRPPPAPRESPAGATGDVFWNRSETGERLLRVDWRWSHSRCRDIMMHGKVLCQVSCTFQEVHHFRSWLFAEAPQKIMMCVGCDSGECYIRHVCCVTQQLCLLCGTADMAAV